MTTNIPKGILTYMTTRTDVHSPANLVTEDYEYVYAFDNGAPGFLVGVDMDWWRSITNWPAATRGRGIHQCHHCGAHIRYVGILLHVPTGEHIAVGETCMENRFERASADFHALRRQAQLDREQQRIKTAATALLDGLTDDKVRTALQKDTDLSAFGMDAYGTSTVSDIRRKLWNYGDLSDKQIAFVGRLIAQGAERAARSAQIAAQRAAEVRVAGPTGRETFEGLVVSRKSYDSDYGTIYKILVKVDDAVRGGIWMAWVSEPSSILVQRGDVVRMAATFTPSADDPSFCKGKRPAKAVVVSTGNTVPANTDLPDSLA